jgi:toxin CcdB
MARFDVHARRQGPGLLLDCQADLLAHLNTRLVVPLIPLAEAPKPAARLNPVFKVAGADLVMVTQYAAAVELRELGDVIGSLAGHDHATVAALDLLITGI